MTLTNAQVTHGSWMSVSYDAERILGLYVGECGNWFDFWGWLAHAPKDDVLAVLREAAWMCAPEHTHTEGEHWTGVNESRPEYLALHEFLSTVLINFEYLRAMKRNR